MSKYTTMVTDAGDRVLSAITDAQEAVVSAVASVSEFVGSAIPELPQLPLVNSLPTPKEVVEQSFSFAGRLLDSQKTYATEVLGALEPITGKVIHNGTAKKSAPRKTAAKADA
jgi:hypothetical protein